MRRDEFRRHTEQFLLGLIRIRHHTAQEVLRAAGNIGQSFGDEPSRTTLGHRQSIALDEQQPPHDLFQGFPSRAVDMRSQFLLDLINDFDQEPVRFLIGFGAGRQMKFDAIRGGENRGPGIVIPLVDGSDRLIYGGFRHAADFDDPPMNLQSAGQTR